MAQLHYQNGQFVIIESAVAYTPDDGALWDRINASIESYFRLCPTCNIGPLEQMSYALYTTAEARTAEREAPRRGRSEYASGHRVYCRSCGATWIKMPWNQRKLYFRWEPGGGVR